MKTLIILVSILLTVAGFGCIAVSRLVTPADIDRNAVEYVVDSGLSDGTEYEGYPNLDKAAKLSEDVDNAHSTVQLSLQQQAEKDNLEYSIHKDVTSNNLNTATQREEMLFGETGLLSMGMSLLGFGGLTGFIGLMRKRPGDITPAEMEQALATATGKTVEELTAKQKQLIQLVQGIQQFMNTYPDSKKDFKAVLTATQDTDTQIAVSSVKAELNL